VKRAVLASANPGKLRELTALLAPLSLQLVPQGELGIESPPETGATFLENALLKARHASGRAQLPALADDSGLEVAALGGRPGVRSARFAGETASDQDNLQRLRAMRNPRGDQFTIATLPMPGPLYCDGVRLPASYANFYIANGVLLMPSFGCAADEVARTTLAQLFPYRRVVAIPSTALIWGLGAIHCLTQQHPAP